MAPRTNTTAAAEAPDEGAAEAPATRVYDSNKRVTVYDTVSGEKLPYKVPETHLDGRFPNLKETPSSKAGN